MKIHVCAIMRMNMHLGVMKLCMFIRAYGCHESFACVHDHESISLIMRESTYICGLELP